MHFFVKCHVIQNSLCGHPVRPEIDVRNNYVYPKGGRKQMKVTERREFLDGLESGP